MSLYIVFDTNYFHSMGGLSDYKCRTIPNAIKAVLESATKSGYIITIPQTVNVELSAWINHAIDKDNSDLARAHTLLKDAGYSIEPAYSPKEPNVNAFELIASEFNQAYLLEPELNDYKRAEYLASNRLDPKPKNPEHEEFRDRIIWSQVVRITQQSDTPALIVSGDKIFENGAESKEGKNLNISIAKDHEELMQKLGERPPHIDILIAHIQKFAPNLKAAGLELDFDKIKEVRNLRSVREDGAIIKRFVLAGKELASQLEEVQCQLLYIEDEPWVFIPEVLGKQYEITRKLTAEEAAQLRFKQQIAAMETQAKEQALRDIISSS